MLIRKSFKFKIKTNEEIKAKLNIFAGHSRFIWNYFLKLNEKRLKNKQKIMWYEEMSYWNSFLKSTEEYSFLKEAPSQILQQKLKDLARGYKDGFDKKQRNKRLPKVRKKEIHNSFRFPVALKIEHNRMEIPKIGKVSFFNSRKITGKIKNVTISKQGNSWYVALQTEEESNVQKSKLRTEEVIGLDVGITNLVTIAGIEKVGQIPAINMMRHNANKLAKAQRKLKNKIKFSNNWKKCQCKIRKIHTKIANSRKDYLHKLTTELSKNHAYIVVEDLKVSNMSKSAKGSSEKPGRSVSAKSGLNKSILDQGWYALRRQLEYKLQWRGGELIKIDPKYTSQTCSSCGYSDKDNRISQSGFVCKQCLHAMNADINAAKNILAVGHTVLACRVGAMATTMKQEPLKNCKKVSA